LLEGLATDQKAASSSPAERIPENLAEEGFFFFLTLICA
jgi:hypothetical protein